MFEPIDPNLPKIHFVFDGQTIAAQQGATVAAALLAAGITSFRKTPVSGALRGPFCMMGACFDCLVSVEGQTVQACMTPVRDGLSVNPVPTLSENDPE